MKSVLGAPLSAEEIHAIDRAMADLKHYVAVTDAEHNPTAILELARITINKAFTLRSTLESAFTAAERRAFAPRPKANFNCGYAAPEPRKDSKIGLLRELGLTGEAETTDLLKQLGLGDTE